MASFKGHFAAGVLLGGAYGVAGVLYGHFDWGVVFLAGVTTAIGALLNHITGGHIGSIDSGPRSYQPMNINFGLFPPLASAPKNDNGRRLRGVEKALAKKRALACRALVDLERWIGGDQAAAAE